MDSQAAYHLSQRPSLLARYRVYLLMRIEARQLDDHGYQLLRQKIAKRVGKVLVGVP